MIQVFEGASPELDEIGNQILPDEMHEVEEGKDIEEMQLRTGTPLMPYVLASSLRLAFLSAISTSRAWSNNFS